MFQANYSPAHAGTSRCITGVIMYAMLLTFRNGVLLANVPLPFEALTKHEDFEAYSEAKIVTLDSAQFMN